MLTSLFTAPSRIKATAFIAILLTIGLTGCSSMGRIERHGHILTSEDLSSIKQGMSESAVLEVLGTPDTRSTVGGSVFYYISHRTRTVSLFKPDTINRTVVAVYFNKNSSVTKIAKYGMKDGKIFDYISRTTPSHGGDYTFLQQMFGNLGKGLKPSF